MRAAECYVVCKGVMGEGIRGGTCNGRMVERPFFGEIGEGVGVGGGNGDGRKGFGEVRDGLDKKVMGEGMSFLKHRFPFGGRAGTRYSERIHTRGGL